MDEEPAQTHLAPVRSAAIIAALTLASRVAGLVRTLVATSILGLTFLGNVYASANAVPNLLFEIVAGGALAAILVPSLSRALTSHDRQELSDTASAFATRTMLFLTPVVVVGLLLRGPLMELLTARVDDLGVRSAQRDLGEFLLLAFLPQIWLYGLGMVATGVLHAHNRFAGPALAPLLSSIVVTVSYLIYGAVEGSSAQQISEISHPGKLILGFGTSAGVVVLSGSLIFPLRRLGLVWRVRYRMKRETLDMARRLLGSALVAVGAQQALLASVIVIANSVEGGVVAYQLAFTLMLLPWATLALPIATAAFPSMAEAAIKEGGEFASRCAEASRNVALVVFGGAAILFAVANPLSAALTSIGIGSRATTGMVANTVAAFAPAVVGFGGYAFLTRASYALGDARSGALGAIAGFGGALVANIAGGLMFEGQSLIGALAASFSIGLALGSGVLVLRLRKQAGHFAFEGLSAACVRGLAAGTIAAAAGVVVAGLASPTGAGSQFAVTLMVALLTVAAYIVGQRVMGDRQMARAVALIRSR